MKVSKFSPEQITKILKEFEHGKKLEQIKREYGISSPTFYNWRKKYGGLEASELRRIKELEEENAKLKRMYANLALDLETARYIIEKSSKALREEIDC